MTERPRRAVVDLSAVTHRPEMYAALQQGLGLPESSGTDWDALWDALTGEAAGLPEEVVLISWTAFAAILPQEAGTLRRMLDEEYPAAGGTTRFTYA